MRYLEKWMFSGLLLTSTSLVCADQPNTTKMMNAPAPAAGQREITPSASPMVPQDARFFFTGDFIYWQAAEDNLVYAVSGDAKVGAAGTSTAGIPLFTVTGQGSGRFLGGSYSPGFKFGTGLDFAYDGWDTFMNYTWYKGSDSGQATAGVGSASGGLGGLYFSDNASVSGAWNLYFNNIDWSLGRKFFISPRLTLRPHMGLKGAWNHQNFSVQERASGTYGSGSYANTTFTCKFWGVGFRTGLDTEWVLGRGFSIYGDFAFSELWGKASNSEYQVLLDTHASSTTPVVGANLGNHNWVLRPVGELTMGFRYDLCFGEDDYYHFLLQAGWEQQIWWSQNGFVSIQKGDLMFQGLDVRAGFTF